MTVAPLIADGVLITGISGAEFCVRGFLDGWNPDSGTHLWRRYTIPAPGEKGSETWPAGDAYLHGGGSTWSIGGPAMLGRGSRRRDPATISTPTLWQFQTGSGITAQPITFTHNGQQYITVLSGLGGLYWNQAHEILKNVPQGGSVWTFAL